MNPEPCFQSSAITGQVGGGQFVGRALGWLHSLCPYLPYFSSPLGRKVVVVRCEGINISGNFYRNKCELGPGRRAGEGGPGRFAAAFGSRSEPASGGKCSFTFPNRPLGEYGCVC